MNIISFILEIYFATMLGVSGVAKLNEPMYFENTLKQQRILPTWSINPATKTFPWIEISIALLLIAGVFAVWNALLLLVLFVVFAAFKVVLLVKGYDKDCGCFGSAKTQQVDIASVIVSILLVLCAGLHAWLVFYAPFTNWRWRLCLLSIALILATYSMMRIRIKSKISLSSTANSFTDVVGVGIGSILPPFTALDQYGNIVDIQMFRGKPCILLFILLGCSACPDALKILQRMTQKETDVHGLVIADSDVKRNEAYASQHHIQVPVLTSTTSLLEEYNVHVFPFAMVLDTEGVVRAAGIVTGYEQLRMLLSITRKSERVEIV